MVFAGFATALIPVSKSSDVFSKVLAPLQNAYLYNESKEAFRYTSAFLFNNPALQEKYYLYELLPLSLDGISCSVYEFVPIEEEDPSLSLLIKELKDKDLSKMD
ncbi:hypothetical protein CRUP_016664 [Coryphaenoides rupestris]|nr:hypothetical protein CRUP_016664 [Coryphaenoides rupestris]